MQPNVVTYCGIIAGLARSRQPGFVKTARGLWSQLRASGQLLDAAAYRTGENVCWTSALSCLLTRALLRDGHCKVVA